MLLNCFLVAFMVVTEASGNMRKLGIDPGPSVRATRGEVWPQPQAKVSLEGFFVVRPDVFQFKVVGENCEILRKALDRYRQELKAHDKTRKAAEVFSRPEVRREVLDLDENYRGYLDELSVDLKSPCEARPHADMDEHYELRINSDDFPNAASLISQSIWGILRGLESWSHLVHASLDNSALMVNSTSIMDFPRYPHRGLLIDTSRHFLPLRTIFAMLDAMVMSKFNVLHWHIVDDQSFPFQSRVFPLLSAKGAYAPTHVYSPADVQAVIDYAADRGIRVISEFDTPGHTRSWGEGYPELLTKCYRDETPDGSLGAMNPIVEGTYLFMREFLQEIKDTFPDSYIHLGGDEVDFKCWASNPELWNFMKRNKWTPKNLQEMYIIKIIEMVTEMSMTPIVWQEMFDDGAALPNNTFVHIWKSNYRKKLYDVTRKGYKVLLSSCWYLDGLKSGGDWELFYACEPSDFDGSDHQKKLVVGGEACMWGEVVDVNNVLQRVWPRASAAAEVLWSPTGTRAVSEAARRLEEHTCRMNRRKIPAQPPNGPGFCPGVNFM